MRTREQSQQRRRIARTAAIGRSFAATVGDTFVMPQRRLHRDPPPAGS
jgi:hypothetical protein